MNFDELMYCPGWYSFLNSKSPDAFRNGLRKNVDLVVGPTRPDNLKKKTF